MNVIRRRKNHGGLSLVHKAVSALQFSQTPRANKPLGRAVDRRRPQRYQKRALEDLAVLPEVV
ncbi:hypothetical protein E2C01_021813 [Portunus trituberculatus]|uniref:Uncharacterized protein n=1 Tax=Portunus trituberculatus TaxID=210409 RepID=A0A5B7E5M2_PORTR|nr:hypothetical protein [Portunus trituberculatus]